MTAARYCSCLLAFAACGDPEPVLVPSGPHYQYVVSDLRVARTNTEARDLGQDLNGDDTVDNQLGFVFSALISMGFAVDETAQEAVQRGGLIFLADLQTDAFDDAHAAGVTTFLGQDPLPSPCLDSMQLATCGQHLRGTGQFTVKPDSASDVGVAPIEHRVLAARIDRLPVEIALADPLKPVRIVLHGARIRLSSISETGASAKIAGGITKADIQGAILPEAALQLDRIVSSDCSGSPCTCPVESRGYNLQRYFDANRDCRIDLDEVAKNSVATSLLSPDLVMDGEELLSFGVGAELVSATFAQ